MYFRNDDDSLSLMNRPSKYYNNVRENSWYDDPRVLSFAKEIDNVTYVGNRIFINKEGLPIPDTLLSGGFKTLTMMLKYEKEKFVYPTSKLGDNCWKLLAQIQNEKDYYMFNDSAIFDLSKNGVVFTAMEDGRIIDEGSLLVWAQDELGGWFDE